MWWTGIKSALESSHPVVAVIAAEMSDLLSSLKTACIFSSVVGVKVLGSAGGE